MMVERWTRLLAIGLVGLGLAACGGGDGEAPESTPGEDGAVEQASQTGTEDEATDAEAGADEGTTALPTRKPVKRSLVEQGQRRTMGFDEAVEKLPFTPYEPSGLPSGSTRTVVHFIEPIEGIENPALPAVRFIYDIDGSRSVILVQAVAHDDLGEGDDYDLGGTPARVSESGGASIIVFERDGIHVELRGSGMTKPQVIELAESLLPYTEAGSAAAEPDAPADASSETDSDQTGDDEASDGADEGSDG